MGNPPFGVVRTIIGYESEKVSGNYRNGKKRIHPIIPIYYLHLWKKLEL
jgi:hypothetical protein